MRAILLIAAAAVAIGACGSQPVSPSATASQPAAAAQGSSTAADQGTGPSAPADQPAGIRIAELNKVQSQVSGKPVAYFFTAPGCASCIVEVRAFQTAAKSAPNVQLVGVDVASQDSLAFFSQWLSDSGLGANGFFWTVDTGNKLVSLYGVTALGASVLIDSTGIVRFRNTSSGDSQTLLQQLKQLS